MLHHKACNAGAESTEIIAPNISGAYIHIFSLHATNPQHLNTPHMELLKLLGECIALWGEPNELSIQHRVYIFMHYVDS